MSMWLSMINRGIGYTSVGVYLFIYYLMIQQALDSYIGSKALRNVILYTMIGGMLSIVMGAVLKAVSFKDFKKSNCFFTY